MRLYLYYWSGNQDTNNENELVSEEGTRAGTGAGTVTTTTTTTTTNIAMVTTSSMTTNEKTKKKSLALNSHMDYFTMARLLRNLENEDYNRSQNKNNNSKYGYEYEYEHLSLYGIELDYNVSHEICDQLSRWEEIELDHCYGQYVHAVIENIFKHENIRKLYIHGRELDEKTVKAYQIADKSLGQVVRKLKDKGVYEAALIGLQ